MYVSVVNWRPCNRAFEKKLYQRWLARSLLRRYILTTQRRMANFSAVFWRGNLRKCRGLLQKTVNCFCKTLHLRCLTGSSIRLWNGMIAQSLLTRTFLNLTIFPAFVLSFLIENRFFLINCNWNLVLLF